MRAARPSDTGCGAAASVGAELGFAAADFSCAGSGFGIDFGATTLSLAVVSAPTGSITASVAPTGTVCPSAVTIFATLPAPGDGISVSTLSVEISTSAWSSTTMSPSLTSHFRIVPSTTLSPICGMVTSIAISIRREAANRVHYFVGARQNELFKWRTERDVRIERCNSSHRAVEIFERVLADNRRDFAADSARQPILVHDQNFAGLARSREDRFAIERQQRAQIEHLDAEPILL